LPPVMNATFPFGFVLLILLPLFFVSLN